jgi:hypothetical protein
VNTDFAFMLPMLRAHAVWTLTSKWYDCVSHYFIAFINEKPLPSVYLTIHCSLITLPFSRCRVWANKSFVT